MKTMFLDEKVLFPKRICDILQACKTLFSKVLLIVSKRGKETYKLSVKTRLQATFFIKAVIEAEYNRKTFLMELLIKATKYTLIILSKFFVQSIVTRTILEKY